MKIHLIDGTYELFRQYFGQPPYEDANGMEVGAVRGVLQSVVQLLEEGATHVGVATDHVIESFRNQMFAGYKTGEGIEPLLFAQFPVLEQALIAMGVYTWACTDEEADDALASAAAVASENPEVEQVIIMTPDKDLHQCVVGNRIVQYDRRNEKLFNEDAVHVKFGVGPESVTDYLALVGDTADGIPGIKGWGAKSTSAVLGKFTHLENIPRDVADWGLTVRSAATLAANLFDSWTDVLLYRELATLRVDRSLLDSIDELRWSGPKDDFGRFVEQLKLDRLAQRVSELSDARTK